MQLSRRRLIVSAASLIAAPAIVRASSIDAVPGFSVDWFRGAAA